MSGMVYVTVEMQSTPFAGLTDAHLEAFSSALWARAENVKGAAPGANLATGTLHMIASVDVADVARATALAATAFRAALKAAGVEASVGEVVAYLGEPGRTELLDGVGIAERLGVSRQRVYQLMAEPRFPRPAATLGGSHVWRWGDVADWLAIGGRRKSGRPRKVAQPEAEAKTRRRKRAA